MNITLEAEVQIKPNTNKEKNMKRYGNLNFLRGSSGFDAQPEWLIKSFIPSSSFGVIYGASGSLKSFLAIDLCCSIATGENWCGKTVKKGAVVYIAAEGQSGVSKRIKAWEIKNNTTARNLYVLGHSLVISDEETQESLISSIKDIEQEDNVKIQLVVLDTLARCYSGDENTSRDMSAFVRGCDNIKSKTNVAMMCIHHSGRDENKGARGSSALRAACDFEFQVKRNGNAKKINFINTKQKEDDEAPSIELEFDSIELGIKCDQDQPITSLAKTSEAYKDTQEQVNSESPIVKLIHDVLGGKTTRGQLRQALYPNDTKLTDAQRKQLSRSLNSLQDSGVININKLSLTRSSDDDIITIV
ncbi:helicase RepA family protein [Oceanisphaera arctica]|uniref:Uncharacterized protein n=1 Tax=Oceanisphaera arctica TaxID=641510 RepID=A0A2P5TK41_9GAMM|nr:helicase RepA family protein [Oceanisphaera arctica]PPL15479.1 hypothetical protein UN63_12440 [Oceanisphaera arctica]GHA05354.1 hypothetical protein GCM10007082_02800 [Oceanisphaera arctica]